MYDMYRLTNSDYQLSTGFNRKTRRLGSLVLHNPTFSVFEALLCMLRYPPTSSLTWSKNPGRIENMDPENPSVGDLGMGDRAGEHIRPSFFVSILEIYPVCLHKIVLFSISPPIPCKRYGHEVFNLMWFWCIQGLRHVHDGLIGQSHSSWPSHHL